MPVDPVASALSREPVRMSREGARPAAVALVFGPADELLLIRRAEKPGDPWSGHVGLPGGHVEPGESWLDAAIRETREEVGLDLGRARVLGGLDDCGTPGLAPSRIVRPFVFRVETYGRFELQTSEVAAAHLVPLELLLAGVGRGRFEYPHGGASWTLPCVDLPAGRLWGMTLRMVDDLLDRIDQRGIGLDRPTAPHPGH